MASCVPDADYASLSDAAFLLQVSQGTVAGTGVALVGNGILDLLEIKLKKKKKAVIKSVSLSRTPLLEMRLLLCGSWQGGCFSVM